VYIIDEGKLDINPISPILPYIPPLPMSAEEGRNAETLLIGPCIIKTSSFIPFKIACCHQGCQSFLGAKYHIGGKYTKWG
jgi:hypothetical protein